MVNSLHAAPTLCSEKVYNLCAGSNGNVCQHRSKHSKASGGAYVPHGLCGLKVYKSVEYGSAMLSKVSNRRSLIKDMHIWYLNMAITGG